MPSWRSMRASREGADDYALAVIEHGRAVTESDIDWLDEAPDRRGQSQREV